MEDDSQPCGLPQEDAREPEEEGQEGEGQEEEDALEVRQNTIETLKLLQRRLFRDAAYIRIYIEKKFIVSSYASVGYIRTYNLA